ncbi:peptidase S8/S53 domain-containing protein [Sphaerosporella brunnea]|uniref:Peptidase S8/S53 domain-containing protein n=1 Tax=Sphaerosporella brunnea TaxID=1250544 RepID=A0A5J5EKQ1_9PEZI|nr:peptidase S8/S53 domain-containing protein [Sphaerosporella brunnea]
MKIMIVFPFVLFGPSLAATLHQRAPLRSGDLIPDQFIVTLKDATAEVASHHDWVQSLVAASTGQVAPGKKAGIVHKYDIGSFKAYGGVFPKDVIEKIKQRSDVASVYQDMIVTTDLPDGVGKLDPKPETVAEDAEKRAPCITQQLLQNEADGEWGLGRISHLANYLPPGMGWPNYTYDANTPYCAGKAFNGGVAYIIDSGIVANHPEFSAGPGGLSRASMGYSADSSWPFTDVCGHGTHVAGIVAGKRYGVMKKAQVIGVKVLEGEDGYCGGSWSGVIAGINWAFTHSAIKNWRTHAVMNLSLGGPFFAPVNSALIAAITGGLTAVVAAGNSYGANACGFSPGSAEPAITVGSTNINDSLSPFSNLGCCVDIFAPGQWIRSAYSDYGTPAYALLSGTSMATPMVAGVVLYNKCRYGYTTPTQDRNGVVDSVYSINNAINPFPPPACVNKMVFNRNNCS